MMARASNHRAASRPEHARANYASSYLHTGRGAGCRNFLRPPARGRAFSLDILFYRTNCAPLGGDCETATVKGPGEATRAKRTG